jgi:hypothetical protein
MPRKMREKLENTHAYSKPWLSSKSIVILISFRRHIEALAALTKIWAPTKKVAAHQKSGRSPKIGRPHKKWAPTKKATGLTNLGRPPKNSGRTNKKWSRGKCRTYNGTKLNLMTREYCSNSEYARKDENVEIGRIYEQWNRSYSTSLVEYSLWVGK